MKNIDIIKATELSEGMLRLSERGMEQCSEENCLILYGVIRDYAYRIKQLVKEMAT